LPAATLASEKNNSSRPPVIMMATGNTRFVRYIAIAIVVS
jgi:hypothetical protein